MFIAIILSIMIATAYHLSFFGYIEVFIVIMLLMSLIGMLSERK